MLYLILSRIRGGKTTHIHNLIEQLVCTGSEKVTLLVPEQFSFTSEKIMLERLGAAECAKVDVLSFTSLAEKLTGESSCKHIDDAGRAAIMSLALDSVKDKLCVFSRHTNSPGVIGELVALESELRQSAVTTQTLRVATASLEDCMLKRKISDIALALEAYSALCAQSPYDDRDLLTELNDSMPDIDYFSGRVVFIDAFRGFTKQEYDIIEGMLTRAKAVYVTLCTENLNNCDDETDIFAHTKRTAARLKAIAAKCRVPVAKPQYLSGRSKYNNFPPHIKRYNREELAALEEELFSPSAQVYEDESGAITVCSAPDIYSECEYIACTAKRLIREEGFRCRDIAVLARSSGTYEAPLRAALRKCGVSVFEDKRQPIKASALIRLVESAIEIAADGFSTQNIMRYLKSGVAGLDIESTALVENYCYLWQINGSRWLDKWTSHPGGFGEKMTDGDAEMLERINDLRERIIKPLLKFRARLDGADGETAARAIFELLGDIGARENLKKLAVSLEGRGETALAIELERVWACLMDLLDRLETVAGSRVIGAKGLRDIFGLMLSVQTIGELPQGLDEITIGSADRVRTSAPKAVFVAGANYGAFPALPGGGAALSDNDRRRLSEEFGIETADYGEYKIAEEKLIAYSALCCASDRLYVTYPKRDARGAALQPSELVSRICELFPKCNKTDASTCDGMHFVEGDESAFEQLAKEKTKNSRLYAALYDYFSRLPAYEGKLKALERASKGRKFEIESKKAAEALFGGDMRLSASRVESFYKCKFGYFCQYALGAKPRLVAKIDPMQRGSVIHYALETLVKNNPGDMLVQLPADERLKQIKSIMNDYLREMLAGEEKDERFKANYEKLAVTVNEVAGRLAAEFAVSEFRPVDFELAIGSKDGIAAYSLPLGTNEKIILTGKIDRVDAAEIDGKKYIRVVDYKSSEKKFSVSDVIQGLNMQMLLYLFTVWKNGTTRYGEVTPAGVLYFAASVPSISAGRYDTAEEIIDKQVKKSRMTGLVLDNSSVLEAMDKTGAFIPVKEEFLIRLRQLERLKQRADSLLIDMAKSLRSGDISAIPVCGANYPDVCGYCNFKTVCLYEDSIERHEMRSIKPLEALRELDGEEAQTNEVD